MKYRNVRVCLALAAAGGVVVVATGWAGAQPATQTNFGRARFAPQSASIKQLTPAVQLTKDEQAPARAFTGPSSMAVDPDDPRTIVAPAVNLRNRSCQLTVSRDGGQTWHFAKEPPGPPNYQYCTNLNAGTAPAMVAFGRNGTLYFAREAYGDGEGWREGKTSVLLARTTNLGKSWQWTFLDDNRSQSGATPRASNGVSGLAVDTSGARNVVYVGWNRRFPDAPTGSEMRNPFVMVATSTDGGVTFGEPVNLNTFPRPSQQLAGKSYQLFMRSSFGSPFMFAHDGTLLVVAGPELPQDDRPQPPPEAGQGLNPGSWYAYPMPQLIARSTDQGKTFTITTLGPPIYAGNGSTTGLGWTPKGGENGTHLAVYGGSPATSPATGIADVVVQRSTDDGVTWSEPLAIDDDPPERLATSFYPTLSVAPNGRVDVSFQDNRDTQDYLHHVRYTYSTDGGETWAPGVQITDRPLNWNLGVSFNSDLRHPNAMASTNYYAAFAWADSRFADDLTQTQDYFGALAQFSPIPPESNTTAPVIAAIFGGLLVAGIVLLLILLARKRGEGAGLPTVGRKEPVAAE